MADKIYNWGIIGPGKIAKKFAEALKIEDRSRLIGVASRDLSRAKAFASLYEAPKAYGDYMDLIRDPEVDVVYIATPHTFHFPIAKACIENNKPVLVEKPMTIDESQSRVLSALSKSKKVFLMEALWTRFIPMTHSILQTIQQGTIGDIQYIKADFGFPAAYSPTGRLFDPSLGGGSLLDVGIYPLFLCYLLLGAPERVMATGRLSNEKIDLDCQATLQYMDNKTASIGSSIHYQMPITAEITGTKGQIQIPCPWYKNHYYYLQTEMNKWDKVECSALKNGFEYEIAEVVDCLKSGLTESPQWPMSSTLSLSKTMDEIKQQLGISYPVQQ